MSRSYKKHPLVKMRRTPGAKQTANRHFRRKTNRTIDDESFRHSHNSYKKEFDSWDIVDYKDTMTRDQAIRLYERALEAPDDWKSRWILEHYPTLKSWLRFWYKNYKMK